ncbi:hypothetical protein HGRIS_009674 [Hohenbuehelia grisea]|uniref:Peroxisomal membrane protein PEX16 n=1 Tax=Hohenbuehelia grisea TaxID=104357 RepID=A0ABR3J1Z4_9AGAR
MSHISFPVPNENGRPNEPSFYPPPFDTGSSAFQMNPLSSHPPRTPRASLASNSWGGLGGGGHASMFTQPHDVHGHAQTFAAQDEIQEPEIVRDAEIDEEEESVKEAEKNVARSEVWREMVLTSNGRDKAFKLIQYSIRVYLFFHTGVTASRWLKGNTRPPWEEELVKRLRSAMSGFSFSRKLLLLFNWLAPLTSIMAQQTESLSSSRDKKLSPKPFLHAALYAPPPVLLELVNAFADDLATLARLGLVGKRTGERAERFSDWCWFFSTLAGLVENNLERSVVGNLQQEIESRLYSESMGGATAKSQGSGSKHDHKELSRLQTKDYWLQISRAKLVMDLIFVSYDLFRLRRAKEPVRAFAGLTAAILRNTAIRPIPIVLSGF